MNTLQYEFSLMIDSCISSVLKGCLL